MMIFFVVVFFCQIVVRVDNDDGDHDNDDYKPESTDRWDREWDSYFRWLSSYLQK